MMREGAFYRKAIMKRAKVAPGASVLLNKGARNVDGVSRPIAVKGDIVTPDEVGPNFDEFVQQGYLIPVSDTEHANPDDSVEAVENAPGTEIRTIEFPDPDAPVNDKSSKIDVKTTEKKAAPKPKRKSKVASRRTLDPAKLQGKTLTELNILVADRDANEDPFESEAEAIAWLSADFEGN